MSGNWSTGICDCCQDYESCLCAWCCPCHQFGKNMAMFGNDSDYCAYCCGWYCLSMFACSCLLGCLKRGEIRAKYDIAGNACGDCCCHYCCMCCALAQEAREIKSRTGK
eukprot:TRINITY_DN1918_c0_g1_i3.p1 TRINITY_DN1918_c0_g1~~TRINITY_DN1918_c0_g1_i3.p1  ORF type:complete len:127 (-),score=17.09 TRINITY_DN1918_c0_g1_i3:186-512(-)